MNRVTKFMASAVLAASLTGCAADMAQDPAKVIGGEVAKLHADLSQFQEETKAYNGYSATRISSSTLGAAAADATTTRLQTEWVLRDAKTNVQVFTTLRDQASVDLAAQTAAPPPLPALERPTFSLDTLSAVSGSLDKIAEPTDFTADAKTLIAYARAVNEQLKKLEEDAAKKASDGN